MWAWSLARTDQRASVCGSPPAGRAVHPTAGTSPAILATASPTLLSPHMGRGLRISSAIGIALGLLGALLLLLVGAGIFWWRRRQRRRMGSQVTQTHPIDPFCEYGVLLCLKALRPIRRCQQCLGLPHQRQRCRGRGRSITPLGPRERSKIIPTTLI